MYRLCTSYTILIILYFNNKYRYLHESMEVCLKYDVISVHFIATLSQLYPYSLSFILISLSCENTETRVCVRCSNLGMERLRVKTRSAGTHDFHTPRTETRDISCIEQNQIQFRNAHIQIQTFCCFFSLKQETKAGEVQNSDLKDWIQAFYY